MLGLAVAVIVREGVEEEEAVMLGHGVAEDDLAGDGVMLALGVPVCEVLGLAVAVSE